jgi:large subunit ribosomal protein L23
MSSIKYPLSTEKAVRLMQSENKLCFVVDRKSTKKDIKEDFEKTYGVKVVKVSTHTSHDGRKRAYIKMSPETPAIDIATRLGLM